ncbi:MAG: hypothetical protein OEQ13_04365, partial [Acidobacteriota bacterium]|nr:hypothetical protein [Acidobacteriota bacterium]
MLRRRARGIRGVTAASGFARHARRLLHRILVGCAWFSVFHPKTILILCGAATAISLYLASGLSLSTDIEDLLPRGTPAARALNELRERYGGTEPLIVTFSGEGHADIEDRIDLALAIRDRLSEDQRLRVVAGLFGEDPWSMLEGPFADALLLY